MNINMTYEIHLFSCFITSLVTFPRSRKKFLLYPFQEQSCVLGFSCFFSLVLKDSILGIMFLNLHWYM